jgi:hypothetical protein
VEQPGRQPPLLADRRRREAVADVFEPVVEQLAAGGGCRHERPADTSRDQGGQRSLGFRLGLHRALELAGARGIARQLDDQLPHARAGLAKRSGTSATYNAEVLDGSWTGSDRRLGLDASGGS